MSGRYALLLVVAMSAILHLSSIRDGHDWGDDFAGYIHQGRALVDGSLGELNALVSYRVENSTDTVLIGPALYPWGLPSLLACSIALFGESLPVMKTIMVLFLLGSQVLTYLLLRNRIDDLLVLVVVFIVGFNPAVFELKNSVVSEMPFLFFVLLSLLLMRRNVNRLSLGERDWKGQVLLGIAILGAFSVRTHGIVLLPTLASVQFIAARSMATRNLTKSARQVISTLGLPSIIPYIVFLFGSVVVGAILSDAIGSYASSGHFKYSGIGEIVRLVVSNAVYYSKLAGAFFEVGVLAYVTLIIPCVVIGVLCRVRDDYDLIVFTAFYVAVLLIFPGRSGIRFLVPVLPMLLYFGISGLRELTHRYTKMRGHSYKSEYLACGLAAIGAACLAFVVAPRWITEVRTPASIPVRSGPYSAASLEMFEYVKQHTESNARVIFWKPRVLSLMTGRRSALVLDAGHVTKSRADYLLVLKGEVLWGDANQRIADIAETHPERFDLMLKNSDFEFFRIKRLPLQR